MTQPASGADDGAPGGTLAEALARLVSNGTLTTAQADAVTREVTGARPAPAPAAVAPAVVTSAAPDRPDRPAWPLLVAEIGGYLGAAFVFGAAVVLLSDAWHDLDVAARLALLGVPALGVAAAAVLTARSTPGGWQPRAHRDPPPGVPPRRRLVATLLTLATVLGGGTVAVAVDSRSVSGDWTAFAFAWTALLTGAAAYRWCRSELIHTLLGVSSTAAALASLRVTGWYGERSTGWVVVAVGVAWIAATFAGLLTERGLGFGWGGVLVFIGAELLTSTDPAVLGYAVLTLLAAGGLAGYTWGRSLTLLVIGAGTLAVVVPQAVVDATDGALSTSGALLVSGLSIVGASALGFRLQRLPR